MSLKVKGDNILKWYGYTRALMPFFVRRPLGYFFYITGRCNLSCDYCWQREVPGRTSENTKTSQNELTGEEWIEIVNSIPRISFIGLTGGEPLLHPDFKKIIRHLGGRFRFTINTNGILLDDDMIKNLIESKASNLSISLDGFSDVHDVSRKHTGLFDHIVERIERLHALKKMMHSKKPSLTIKTVLLDPLLDRLSEFYGFCDEVLKADCLNISIMKTENHAQFDFRTYESMRDISAAGEPACYHYKEAGNITAALANLLNLSEKKCKVLFYPKMYNASQIDLLFKSHGKGIFAPCYIPWGLVVILANGNIIPCLSLKIANIRDLDYDVKRIGALKKYQDFLKWRDTRNRTLKPVPECNMCCFSEVRA